MRWGEPTLNSATATRPTHLQRSFFKTCRQSSPRIVFLITLTVGPLCFGATEPWSLLAVQIGLALALSAWVVACWESLNFDLDSATFALFLFGILGIVQLVLGGTAYGYATEQELVKDAAYLVFFVLAKHLFGTPTLRRQFAAFAASLGGLLAMVAVLQRLQGNGRIYWVRVTTTDSFFGPYANKNHYAGLMEMLLPFALFGAAASSISGAKRALFAFSSTVMIASVFLSGSRTGILIVILEVAVVFAVILRRGPQDLRRIAGLCIPLLALVVWIAGDKLIAEAWSFHDPVSDASVLNRSHIAHDSLHLVADKPVLGRGLGSFPIVYPQAQSWYSDLEVNAAHNDYLQLFVETGGIGFVLIAAFLASVFRIGMKRMAEKGSSTVSAALLGSSGLLLHSFTDFNLHVPANAGLFFALCGIACGRREEALGNAVSTFPTTR